MKKILFIMILATTFIPVSQTGASMRNLDAKYRLETNETQIMTKKVQEITLNSISVPASEEIKKEIKTNISALNNNKVAKNRISSERRDRLFGLLLLAHGGQR